MVRLEPGMKVISLYHKTAWHYGLEGVVMPDQHHMGGVLVKFDISSLDAFGPCGHTGPQGKYKEGGCYWFYDRHAGVSDESCLQGDIPW